MNISQIVRKKQLLDENIERCLQEAGWVNRMIGWQWFWTKTICTKGVDEQFTARSAKEAFEYHRVLVEMMKYYPPEKPE